MGTLMVGSILVWSRTRKAYGAFQSKCTLAAPKLLLEGKSSWHLAEVSPGLRTHGTPGLAIPLLL